MSNEQPYDLAIIGGGLAGLCLAIQCAEGGNSVILFEKEEYPFHKVCGEYISLESWNFLKELGLPLDELNVPIIKNLQLSDVAGRLYNFQLPLGGFGISRYFLDNALYKIALAKGVAVFTKTKVNEVNFANELFTIGTTNKYVSAKITAGCFGKRSNLDVKWKRSFINEKTKSLNNYIGIKYHMKYKHSSSHISLHNFADGYCGISKIEDDKSCLCYLTTAQNLKACNNSINDLQKQVLYKNPHLKTIFENAEFLYTQPLAISQISFARKSQVQNHVFLLGDAAGMISPLCGNGMSMAMHASKIAYKYLKLYLDNSITREIMERMYMNEWNREFSKRLWIGRKVQQLFGNNWSTSVFLKTMSHLPILASSVIKSTHGKPF